MEIIVIIKSQQIMEKRIWLERAMKNDDFFLTGYKFHLSLLFRFGLFLTFIL